MWRNVAEYDRKHSKTAELDGKCDGLQFSRLLIWFRNPSFLFRMHMGGLEMNPEMKYSVLAKSVARP